MFTLRMCGRYDVKGTARKIQQLAGAMIVLNLISCVIGMIALGDGVGLRLFRSLRLIDVLLNLLLFGVLGRYIAIFKAKIPQLKVLITFTVSTFLLLLAGMFIRFPTNFLALIYGAYVIWIMHKIRCDPKNQASEEQFSITGGLFYSPLPGEPRVEPGIVVVTASMPETPSAVVEVTQDKGSFETGP